MINVLSNEKYNELQTAKEVTVLGKPIFYNGEPVTTTKLLARAYECEEYQIKQNYNNNPDRFEEKVHYYKLEGEELKQFKQYCNKVENFYLVEPKAKSLMLWTKRGASRHSKMLDTDKAWDMFDILEESYFNQEKPQENPFEKALAKVINSGLSEEMDILLEEQARKTIEIEAPKYFNKGIKQGYGQGYTQAELEGKAKLKKELNGQDRGYTYSQLCTTINEQYHGRVKIIASFITDYLLEEGYFEKEIFPAQVNGKIKYKNGQIVKENKATTNL